jgi:uncharacterized protein involved in exopolysaccharide biosynthesis
MATRTTTNIPTLPEGGYATPVPLTEQPMTGSRAYFIETPIPQARFVEPPVPPVREAPPPQKFQYLTAVSVILGICLGLAAILGGLGRAFYVEKDAYTEDKIKVINDLNTVNTSLTKINSKLDELEAIINSLETRIKETRDAPQRRR